MSDAGGRAGGDPTDRFNEPAPEREAAGYLIELLASMSHFANISNLHNSSVVIAAASAVVDQACRYLTEGPPKFSDGPPANWPYKSGSSHED